MSRQARIALGLAVLLALSGCLGAIRGPQAMDDEALDQEPAEPYNFDADVDAHITVTSDATFRAVYRVGDREELELFRRDGLGGRNALSVRAVRFQYANGTVITGSEFDERGGEITETREEVKIVLPADATGGKLAFTADSTPKRFAIPAFLEGSYHLVLPPDRSIDFFLFSNVHPRGYETRTVDGQTHIEWENVESDSVLVRFYHERDLTLFGGGVLVLGTIAVVGLNYYRRKIEELERQRKEMGLDVEEELEEADDEFDDGPPPGMR